VAATDKNRKPLPAMLPALEKSQCRSYYGKIRLLPVKVSSEINEHAGKFDTNYLQRLWEAFILCWNGFGQSCFMC